MSAHTPGQWTWWTSNSWRRLRSDLGHGKTADVLMPCVHRDGHPDITVSDADMKLIEAAPLMLAALMHVRSIIVDGAMTGFNCHDGDWAQRLFDSQAMSFAAVEKAAGKEAARSDRWSGDRTERATTQVVT